MPTFNNQGLDHVAIGVSDVERSRAWYADALGFVRTHEEWDVPVMMSTRAPRRASRSSTGV